MALLAACCFATSHRVCGGGCWRTRERPGRGCWVHSGCVLHTGGGWRWQLGAEEGAGAHGSDQGEGAGAERVCFAHGRGQSEGAGCTVGVFCTREVVGGERCVQRRVLVHTGATGARVLGAERAPSAHGSAESGACSAQPAPSGAHEHGASAGRGGRGRRGYTRSLRPARMVSGRSSMMADSSPAMQKPHLAQMPSS